MKQKSKVFALTLTAAFLAIIILMSFTPVGYLTGQLPATRGQGQIGAAAVDVPLVCLGQAVAQQKQGPHLMRCGMPQNSRQTSAA